MPTDPLFPNNRRGAVSFTYDDALNVHIDNAMPDLEQFGLRGTFYVPTRQNPNGAWAKRPDDWKKGYERGHEIGNHTMFHPCAEEMKWVPRAYVLEGYDLRRMEAELRGASEDIYSVIGDRPPISFAYPCCQEYVGKEHVCYRPICNKLFPASRGGDDRLADPIHSDMANVPSFVVVDKTPISDTLAFIDSAVTENAWAILMFHGIGGEHNMNCSQEMHQAICRHVQSRKDELWCDTLVNVALHIRQKTGREWKEAR